jgi:hypothetical protein
MQFSLGRERLILLPVPSLFSLYPNVAPGVIGTPERQKNNNKNRSRLHVIRCFRKVILFDHGFADVETKTWSG